MATAGERAAAAEVLAKAKARTARISLCLDGELEDRLEMARSAFAEADSDSDEAAALAEALVAVEADVEKASTEFVFQVARGKWRKLKADHPPTDEQKALGAEFDTDEFPFVAMSAFLVSPVMSVDDLKALDDEVLDEVKFAQLWGTCCRAAMGVAPHPSSQAARQLLNARGNSKPPSNSGLAAVS